MMHTHALTSSWPRVWILLILLGALVTLVAAPLPQIDGDGPLYGKIAKNVLASGDWLTFYHHPGWLVDKPPLTIWLLTLSLRLVGSTDVALRSWQLLLCLALVWVTYGIARLGAGREEASLAALVLLTTSQVFYQNLVPQQDIALTLFLALAFYGYLQYRRDGSTVVALLTGLSVALAVLAKGVVAVAVFGLVVVADLLLPRPANPRPQYWRWAQVAGGAAIFLAVAAPWFVVGAVRQGRPFVETFFFWGTLGLGRFLHPVLSAQLPYWKSLLAYVPLLALGALPWTGFLPGAISEGWRSLRAGPPSMRLCALWAGLYFLMMSVSPGDKVLRYLLPLYPPIAVLSAMWLGRVVAQPRPLRLAAAVTLLVGVPLLAFTVWLAAGRFPEESRMYIPALLPFLVALSAAIAAFVMTAMLGWGRKAVAVLAVATMLSFGVLEWSTWHYWRQLWPWHQVEDIMNRLYRPGDRVLFYADPAIFSFAYFYSPIQPTEVASPTDLLRVWQGEHVFAIVPTAVFADLRDQLHATVLVQMKAGWVLVASPASAALPEGPHR